MRYRNSDAEIRASERLSVHRNGDREIQTLRRTLSADPSDFGARQALGVEIRRSGLAGTDDPNVAFAVIVENLGSGLIDLSHVSMGARVGYEPAGAVLEANGINPLDLVTWPEYEAFSVLDMRSGVSLAADVAESVLRIFEAAHPDDDLPRKAVAAARSWVNNPTTTNARLARRVYNEARAAQRAYFSEEYEADLRRARTDVATDLGEELAAAERRLNDLDAAGVRGLRYERMAAFDALRAIQNRIDTMARRRRDEAGLSLPAFVIAHDAAVEAANAVPDRRYTSVSHFFPPATLMSVVSSALHAIAVEARGRQVSRYDFGPASPGYGQLFSRYLCYLLKLDPACILPPVKKTARKRSAKS